MKIMVRQMDLSDEYIRFAQQIGADGIDIHNAESIPGFAEQFYPDKDGLAAIQQRIQAAGMKIYRVAPPELKKFLRHEPGGEEELAMDDGDMSMLKVLKALRDVGFEDGLQVDHVPSYSGDDNNRRIAWAYAVGYIKATIAALYA